MDVAAERRFQSKIYSVLKKRLDSLHYCQPLSMDSASLAERLLSDLLKTTEGFQQLKQANADLQKLLGQSKEARAPLESEVARLHASNNALHQSLMSVKEETDKKDAQWRSSLKQMQAENADLKFLLDQGKDNLRAAERTNLELRDRLDTLLTNQAKQPFGIEVNKHLPPTDPASFKRVDNDWADALRKADERARLLQDEINFLRANSQEREVEELKLTIENRDREIERLTNTMGPNLENISHKHQQEYLKESVQNLQEKIDFLNSENIRLEEENAKAKKSLSAFVKQEKVGNAMVENLATLQSQNKFLQERLQDLDKPDLEKEQLRNTVKSLQQELQSTKHEAETGLSLKAAYTSDKKAYTEAISQVDHENERLITHIQDLERSRNELENQLRAAKEQSTLYLAQTQNLKKELETTQQSFTRANQQSISSTEESFALRQQISALTAQNQIQTGELENLRFELERAQKQRQMSDERLDDLRKAELRSKSEVDSQSAAQRKLEVLHSNAQKEITNLKEEVSYLTKLREKDRAAVLEFEDKVRSLNGELAGAEHRIRVVQQEHASISDELSQNLTLLRQQQQTLTVQERELAELRPVKTKYHTQQEHLKIVHEQSSAVREDTGKLQRQLVYLEDQLQARDSRISNIQEELERAIVDKSKAEGRAEELEEQLLESGGHSRQTEALSSESQQLRQQLLETRERERDALKQLEQAKGESRRATDSARLAERQVQRAVSQREGAEAEVAKVKEQLAALQTQDTHAHGERMRLEERAFQSELQAEELRRQLSQEHHQRFRVEDQAKSLGAALDSEKQQVVRLQDQNTQLKGLIENLERTREELLKKIQEVGKERSNEEAQQQQHLSDLASLRMELSQRTDEIAQLREAVGSLDQERDFVQGLLDQKTEEMAALESTVLDYQAQLNSVKEQVAEARGKDMNVSKRLEERDGQLKRLSDRAEALHNELEEARAAYAQQHREVQELKEQVIAITKENQFTSEQLMKTVQEKENLKHQVAELARGEKLSQQMLRGVEREKEDLLLTYRKACEENERLAQSMGAVNSDHKEIYARLQACEQELVNAQNHIASQERALFAKQQEISTLERQVTHMTHQLELAERQIQEANEAREHAVRDASGMRSVSMGIESTRDDIQRQIAAAENEKLTLISKLKAANSEVSALKSQLEYERKRYSELEMVLANEREQLRAAQKATDEEETKQEGDFSKTHRRG